MRGDPPISLEALLVYFRGVYFATTALEQRLAALGPEGEAGRREVERYRAMVRGFRKALEETAQYRSEHAPP